MLEPSNLSAIFYHDFKNAHIPEILDEIYTKKVYKPFLVGKRDLTIIDVGANIGLFTQYAAEYAKKVYALEPSALHLEALGRLVTENKLTNVQVLPLALSNENGTTRFYHNDNVTMFSMEDTVNNKEDFEEVPTCTLDKLFETEGIEHVDLLKLDVEGSEHKVITSEGFDKVKDKIDVIVGEWHSWCPMNQDQFRLCFEDKGFQFHWRHDTDASVFTAVRI
jgi:FkbM family methyltransferase